MWKQLRLSLPSAMAEATEAVLLASGAVSVSILDASDQPLFQEAPGSTPLWDSLVMLALFDTNTRTGPLEEWLASHAGKISAAPWETIEDEHWERRWMDGFSPMQFGPGLWICPGGQQPPDPEATNILLDPGLAFGSGSHETTAMCLEWLDAQTLAGKHVIDYGCGSGVLGIAACLLGAGRVTAVDNDPQAITATTDNCARNAISQGSLLACLPEDLNEQPADMLVANILAGPLQELASRFASLCKPGAPIALSGILQTQASAVEKSYAPWFDLGTRNQRNDWVLLAGNRR